MASAILEAHGLRYHVQRDVYDPSDDTFLLLEGLARLTRGRLLEVGTGAGLVAIGAALRGHDVTATDISSEALKLARSNARLNGAQIRFVRADVASGLRLKRFDAVVFNPPYLPTAPDERVPGILNHAFDGGPTGLAVARRFLETLPPDTPPVLILASDLQPAEEWAQILRNARLHAETVSTKRLAHETLRVLRLTATRKG